MTEPGSGSETAARSPTRRGRFPSPSVCAAIARVETRRTWRRLREQDVWLAVIVLGALGMLFALPVLFGLSRDLGADLAAGETGAVSTVVGFVAAIWLFHALLAVASGVGSEGEVDDGAAVLSVRPPRDVAGGLFLGQLVGYAPFLVPPAVVAFAGLSVGAGSPAPMAGGLAATAVLLLSSLLVGYPIGLASKGAIRRSPQLARLKPVLGLAVGVGYVWVIATGRVERAIDLVGSALSVPPVGWLGDLALVTTPGADVSVAGAAGVLVLALVSVPVGVLATVRAAEYAWYVDRPRTETGEVQSGDDGGRRSLADALDAALGAVGVRPATRAVATTTLRRAYRSPLQLLYVFVPLVFVLPTLETMVRTGVVPDYALWTVVLYGGWAAGLAVPLNVLGNQGGTLPRLLTAPAGGRRVVHGVVLAAAIPFVPLTTALAAGAGHLAGRSGTALLAVAAVAPVAVVAGAVLAAGVGAVFPRFSTIDLTATRSATLPSKVSFGLFSVLLVVAVTAVGILADDLYAQLWSALLSEYAPYGIAPDVATLETLSWAVVAVVAVAVPVAYAVAVRRIDGYRLG